METIEVRYAWIEGLPGPIFHKYIIYTDYQGNQFIAEARPTTDAPPNPPLALVLAEYPYSILANAPTEFGLIVPTVTGYSRESYDRFPKSGADTNFSELIGTGADLSSQWAIIRQTVLDFGQSYYRPLSQNSNYVADEAIIRAGFPQPVLDGLSGHLAIGSQHQSIFDFIISPAYGGDNVGGLSNTFNLEQYLTQNFNQGLLSQSLYNDFTQDFSDWLVSDQEIPFVPNYTLNYDPIGAFYESQTPTADNAASIANKTPLIFDSGYRVLTSADLNNLDKNYDNKLNGTELSSLLAWADINENGVAEANEITAPSSLNLTEIRSTDYGFYTRGNTRVDLSSPVIPTKISDVSLSALALPATLALPVKQDAVSNYRTLRDGPTFIYANPYIIYTNSWISQDQKTAIGTDSDDSFDFSTFANNVKLNIYVNTNLIENFLGGNGNDGVGGSTRNDNIWGGLGNDLLLGYAGNDKLYGEEGSDQLQGQDGQDYLDGGNDNDQLLGQNGDDTLFGGAGFDELQGGDGNDKVAGETGNDNLFGQTGNDTLWGGDGNDTLTGFTGNNETKQTLITGETDNDTLFGELGTDILYGGLGSDLLDGGGDNDHLFGNIGNDSLFAGTGDDQAMGGDGSDYVDGGAGNDLLLGEAGDDGIAGGIGNDEIQGGDGNDYAIGEAGDDRLFGQVGNDALYGGDGNDIVFGFTGSNEVKQSLNAGESDNDSLFGGKGLDNLYGGLGNDYLDAGDDNDLLCGLEGNDSLFGGNGNDQIEGGDSTDSLTGESGDDRLFGQLGNDVLWGGDGNDILVGFTASNDPTQSLAPGETDNDGLYGGAGNDLLISSLGEDSLHGESGADELQGGAGNDLLYGEEGDDRLFGQVGDDVLYGGNGNDTLVGFAGSNESQTLNIGESDNDWLYGGAGTDYMLAGPGNDYLDGGAGADAMEGGGGDDTYIVNSVNDNILELAGSGYDIVVSSANYLLNQNIEELHLLEGFDIHGTGNALNNKVIGNNRNNILDGVTGQDTLMGAGGDDTYYVDDPGDQVIELTAEGSDRVQSGISYTLGSNVEDLILLDFSKPEKGLVDGVATLVYGYPKRYELDYMQGDTDTGFQGTCALTAIANLLTQAGRPISETAVVQIAINNSWAVTDPSKPANELGGSNSVQQQAILDSYGIRNDLLIGYNEQGIANLVMSGRGVMIALNAGKLWDDQAYIGSGSVNHVVTVTGAVYSEIDDSLMGFYIADSGRHKVTDMTRYVSIGIKFCNAHRPVKRTTQNSIPSMIKTSKHQHISLGQFGIK